MAQIKCEATSQGQSAGEPFTNDHFHIAHGTAGIRQVTSEEKAGISNLFVNWYKRVS